MNTKPVVIKFFAPVNDVTTNALMNAIDQKMKQEAKSSLYNFSNNACDALRERFVIWTLLDTGLTLSKFADLKKENIQWQEKNRDSAYYY